MHGLINRSIQSFLRDTYGEAPWGRVSSALGLGADGFEPLWIYEEQITRDLLSLAAKELGKPEEQLLEDLGTYLVSHPSTEAIRRLLRFAGDTYADFLNSLEDLPDRARLAVDDLSLPALRLRQCGEKCYYLTVASQNPGFAYVFVGLLRALADDYGVLVVLDLQMPSDPNDFPTIEVHVLDESFARGRSFELLASKQQYQPNGERRA